MWSDTFCVGLYKFHQKLGWDCALSIVRWLTWLFGRLELSVVECWEVSTTLKIELNNIRLHLHSTPYFFLFVGQSLYYLRYRALALRNEYIFHAFRFQLVTEFFWHFKILIQDFSSTPFLKMLRSCHDLSLQQLLLK